MLNLKSLNFYCSLIDHKIFLLIQLFIFKAIGFIFSTNYHRFRFFLPIKLKTGRRLKYMFELFIQRNPESREFYKVLDNPKYLCLLDLGANVGSVSHYFLNNQNQILARSVLMVEPQEKCCEFLKKNFKENALVFHLGVGGGTVEMMLYKKVELDVNASFTVDPKKHYGRLSNIPKKSELAYVTTVDTLYIPQKIDLVKINIEGGEPEAIFGMVKLIERDRPDILFDPHNDLNLRKIKLILYTYKITKIDKINYLAEPINVQPDA